MTDMTNRQATEQSFTLAQGECSVIKTALSYYITEQRQMISNSYRKLAACNVGTVAHAKASSEYNAAKRDHGNCIKAAEDVLAKFLPQRY
jgi:hypothetical protein